MLIRTLPRASLAVAVRSIFRQDFPGTIQILIGVDGVDDISADLGMLRAETPERMRVDVLQLGYPTSHWRGGIYANRHAGGLPVLLAYAAAARYVAFLDDDNWAAPDHLTALRDAAEGFDWAFTRRWFTDAASGTVFGEDRWESIGPGRGIFAEKAGGWVDLNCLMFDKLACHFDIPVLAMAKFKDEAGEDRLFFDRLRDGHSIGWTGKPTLYYTIRADDPMHHYRCQWIPAIAGLAPADPATGPVTPDYSNRSG